MANEFKVVQRWLDAVNRREAVALEALSHREVEIVGPRGAGTMSRAVLSEWLLRAGFCAESQRWFCGGDGTVVGEQPGHEREHRAALLVATTMRSGTSSEGPASRVEAGVALLHAHA